MSAADDDPLTLKEASAQVFRGIIGPDALRTYAAKGKLPIFKLGKKDCVFRGDAKAFLCALRAPGFAGARPERTSSYGTELSTKERVAALTSALGQRHN